MTFIWDDPDHLRWLETQRDALLAFAEPHVVDPAGGFSWLDDTGQPRPAEGKGLWISARMVHCWSLAHLLGRPDADRKAAHGVAWLRGKGHDDEFGGWFADVTPDGPVTSKELYGLAHVILAGSSALTAGIPGGRELLDEALDLVDRHFWIDADGAGLDVMDRAFTEADPYRGLNANMHLTEAYLAAYEATGQVRLLDRAVGLAERFARGPIESGRDDAHRLVEHYDESWTPLPDYNRDEPAHPFRPYGSTPGHWLEWAKLCVQIHGIRPELDWTVPVAERLFRAACQEAWADGGGFVYTVDWDGTSVISNRFFWPVTEAIGAAHLLRLATGDEEYASWYERLWRFAHDHLMDHEHGSWHSELDDDLRPTKRTWDGKPDLYHILQATLYAKLPLERGLAAQLSAERG